LSKIYTIAPIAMAALLYFLFPEGFKMVGVAFGIFGGIIFPAVYTKLLISKNKKLFDDQLMDALMIMSSSFRGGLSLIQAVEAVVEEMPDPINQPPKITLPLIRKKTTAVSLNASLTKPNKSGPVTSKKMIP